MKLITSIAILFSTVFVQTAAFAPASSTLRVTGKSLFLSNLDLDTKDLSQPELHKFDFPSSSVENDVSINTFAGPLAAASVITLMPFPALAAGDQIPSALAAYAHYLSLFAMVGLITYERFAVEAGMSKEKEMNIAFADIGTGISGVGILVSGYYRATQYGKGWDFYSHEPIFWLKMVFLCIFGAATLFPTTTFIKRSVAIQTGKELEPMSEKLASRLQQVLTAELVMVASIPLAATLMVRCFRRKFFSIIFCIYLDIFINYD